MCCRFKHICGLEAHPSIWALIEAMKLEDVHCRNILVQHRAGGAVVRRVRRETRDLERRLVNLCEKRRDNMLTLEEALRAIGHNIKFGVAERGYNE